MHFVGNNQVQNSILIFLDESMDLWYNIKKCNDSVTARQKNCLAEFAGFLYNKDVILKYIINTKEETP